MYPFARAVLGNYPRPLKIDLARHSFDQRLRAGNDRGDLERPFQEPLEKRTLIANANSSPRHFACPAAKAGADYRPEPGGRQFLASRKREFDFDSSLYNDEIVNKSCVSRRKLMNRTHA